MNKEEKKRIRIMRRLFKIADRFEEIQVMDCISDMEALELSHLIKETNNLAAGLWVLDEEA